MSIIFSGATVYGIDHIKLIIHRNLALFVINLTMILGGGAVLGLTTGSFLKKILRP